MASVSIIIPVFNKWPLTRQCLVSLAHAFAADGNATECEIIVVDNASTDTTTLACTPTGRALFGVEHFVHVRHEVNRNFAGACNSGAAIAKGEWLVFLNNDTLVTPGWLAPLIQTLTNEATLGAVGPLLLYPEPSLGVSRVQHLGVVFGPTMQVSHLYEFFPSSHPVVCKQRRFQVITAAALVMNSTLFAAVGRFDEGFINGFEDVDLCARLHAQGLGTACIPEARITHLCGQTPGRNDHEAHNSALLSRKCFHLLHCDKARFVHEDGFSLTLSPWLTIDVTPGPQEARFLHKLSSTSLDEQALRAALVEHPLWIAGYAKLAALYEAEHRIDKALSVRVLASRFMSNPQTLIPLLRFARIHDLNDLAQGLQVELQGFFVSRDERIRQLRLLRKKLRAEQHILTDQLHQVDQLLAEEALFYQRDYSAFVKVFEEL